VFVRVDKKSKRVKGLNAAN
jgi:26S proteasome regulatory subunit T2